MSKSKKTSNKVADLQRPYIRTSMNFELMFDLVGDVEHPVGVSMTVPGQVIDLETLIKRSAQGLPVMGRQPMYSDRDDLPEFYKMDEIELIEYRLRLAEQMEEYREQLHVASKALEEKQKEERKKVDEEYEKRKKFVTENPLPPPENGTGSAEKP